MKWLCSELRMIVCSTTLVLLESLRASTLQTVYRDHWPLYSLINHILLWKSEQIWTWTSCRPTALQPGLQSLLQTRAWSAISFIKSLDSAIKIQRRLFLGIFSDYCAISYRASLSPSDSFEMLTCEKQSSSFNHGFLMNLAEHHHDLPDECPHHPDLVFNKHFGKTWLSNFTLLWKRCLHTNLLFSKQWYDDDGGKLQDSVRQRSCWWGHWGQRQQSGQVT